jgi:drug/metabolite transporter (DMT)-like permease
MGLIQLAIPLVFYARGAKSVNAVTLAVLAMLDAVLNPFWPWLFVNEIPNQFALIGGGIIVVAVMFSIFAPQFLKEKTAA